MGFDILLGRRFGLEDQILLGLAMPRFVYTPYLYIVLSLGMELDFFRIITAANIRSERTNGGIIFHYMLQYINYSLFINSS